MVQASSSSIYHTVYIIQYSSTVCYVLYIKDHEGYVKDHEGLSFLAKYIKIQLHNTILEP